MMVTNLAFALLLTAPTASQDNNVEWDGVTHIGWLDRSPQVPVDGESFTIAFQAYHFDLTSARVYVDDGTPTWVDAEWSYAQGPYDYWTAEIPATAGTTLSYYLELTDGTDVDYLAPPGLGGDGMSDTPPATGWVLDYDTLSHVPLGAFPTSSGGAVFRVWAPTPSSCDVRGDFNGWGTTAMTALGDDWVGAVPTAAPGEMYKYYFDGANWQTDARARALNPADNNNAFLVDQQAYGWADRAFTTPPFEEMVIYEMHVGTFSGLNDGLNRMGLYRDIVDTHLDDLLYLGVNAVELMPITEFDYYESWGYNPIDNWAPEEAYGTPEDLKYTIDVLHQHGIAVILDIVYNHFATSGNYLWYYDGGQIYFDDCNTPWGTQADFTKQEVQDYYLENILHWLTQYRVDGFRMDATSYMRDPLGCYSEGWYLMQDINDAIDARGIDKISIAEELPDNTAITNPTPGGAGFDSQWHDKFNDDVRQEVFDASFGDPEMWRIRNAVIDSSYPDKTKVVNYVEAHDEADDARLAVEIDSGDPYSVFAKGRSKFAQGLTILAPGIPMFLQGGEWMEDIAFNSDWSHRIDWAKAVSRAPILLFFRDVIKLRKANCAFRSDAQCQYYPILSQDESNNVLAFYRNANDRHLVVVGSLNNNNLTNYRVGFPISGTWYEVLNSQASAYDGNGWGNGGSITTEAVAWHGYDHSAEITIPQMGLLVFRLGDPLGRERDLDFDGDVDLRDFALLQNSMGDTGCDMLYDVNEDGRVDADDASDLIWDMDGPTS